MHTHGKVDKHQPELLKVLSANGIPYVVISDLGNGRPDLIVRMPVRCLKCKSGANQNVMVELKTGDAKLTPDEVEWHDKHPGMAVIWRTYRHGKQLIVTDDKGKLITF